MFWKVSHGVVLYTDLEQRCLDECISLVPKDLFVNRWGLCRSFRVQDTDDTVAPGLYCQWSLLVGDHTLVE